MLKPEGTFTMYEINGSGNVYTDKVEFGEDVVFGYAISVLACLPFGSQSEGPTSNFFCFDVSL